MKTAPLEVLNVVASADGQERVAAVEEAAELLPVAVDMVEDEVVLGREAFASLAPHTLLFVLAATRTLFM